MLHASIIHFLVVYLIVCCYVKIFTGTTLTSNSITMHCILIYFSFKHMSEVHCTPSFVIYILRSDLNCQADNHD